jgi:hypothetical protein
MRGASPAGAGSCSHTGERGRRCTRKIHDDFVEARLTKRGQKRLTPRLETKHASALALSGFGGGALENHPLAAR